MFWSETTVSTSNMDDGAVITDVKAKATTAVTNMEAKAVTASAVIKAATVDEDNNMEAATAAITARDAIFEVKTVVSPTEVEVDAAAVTCQCESRGCRHRR